MCRLLLQQIHLTTSHNPLSIQFCHPLQPAIKGENFHRALLPLPTRYFLTGPPKRHLLKLSPGAVHCLSLWVCSLLLCSSCYSCALCLSFLLCPEIQHGLVSFTPLLMYSCCLS